MKFSELVRLLEKDGFKLVKEKGSIRLNYSLVIEATADPTFFGFFSPDLDGFTGIGHSIEDCLYKAKWGMEEHVALLRAHRLPIPKSKPHPTIIIQNEPRRQRLHKTKTKPRKNRAAVYQ
jgi:predicted RNase H-like HicB family nuclease